MKQIPLSRGLFALVDDADYDWLSQWKWYALRQPRTFYAVRDVKVDKKKTSIWMHRLVNGTPDHLKTDHMNGNGLDNRRSNLRSVTHQENMINNVRWVSNRSGVRGVSWHKHTEKWLAQITVNSKNLYIGSYKTLEEAAAAYEAKRREVRAGFFTRSED